MDFHIPTVGNVCAMVDQLPNRGREAEMLQEMGLKSMEDLFSDIPADVRFNGELPLPGPQSEEEIISDARRLLGANTDMGSRPSFLGAGLYRNYVPAAVFQLVTRGEFLTAYTPYQPEVSQGMLQAMWEFQTLISELVGLPIANLSLYDGSTAAAEALTCAVRVHNRKASQPNTVYVSSLTPPDKLSVMFNYCQGAEIDIRTLAHKEDGTLDLDALRRRQVPAEFTWSNQTLWVSSMKDWSVSKKSLGKIQPSSLAFNPSLLVWSKPLDITVLTLSLVKASPLEAQSPAVAPSTVFLRAPNPTFASCRVESPAEASTLMGRKPTV